MQLEQTPAHSAELGIFTCLDRVIHNHGYFDIFLLPFLLESTRWLDISCANSPSNDECSLDISLFRPPFACDGADRYCCAGHLPLCTHLLVLEIKRVRRSHSHSIPGLGSLCDLLELWILQAKLRIEQWSALDF